MKRVALTAVAFALGLTVSVNGAMGQDKMRDVRDRRPFALESGHVDSRNLIGMRVNTPDGKHVGEIDQLLVNLKDGKVSHVIVGFGGLAGIGERHVVVPWTQVKIQADARKDRVATIDPAILDSAPRYARDASRDRTSAASPPTGAAGDRDRDGVPNRVDRAPNNPDKK